MQLQAQTYDELITCALDAAKNDSLTKSEILFKQALKMDPANMRNALLFTNLGTVQRRLGDFSSLLPKLKSAHEARITKDPEFAYVLQDIKEYQADKDKKSVSLNEAERLAEQAKQDEKALARANERLTRLGKPTVKSLDELPTDFEAPDEYQVEAANITADLATLSKNS
jgi:carboxyl-terminal processing protease